MIWWLMVIVGSLGVGTYLGMRITAFRAGDLAAKALGDIFAGIENVLKDREAEIDAGKTVTKQIDLGNSLAIHDPAEAPDATYIGPKPTSVTERAWPRLVQ